MTLTTEPPAEAARPSPRPAIADGVYFDLPVEDYVADEALSGGGFETLLTEPANLHFERDDNPLYFKPERSSKRPQLRGSAAHCAVLEGLAAYGERYRVKPDNVLSTSDDLKGFLRAQKAKHMAALGIDKLGREESKPFVMTGERADLEARCRALDPGVEIWDKDADDILLPADDFYVRTFERFVRSDRIFSKYISGGLAEVSIFLTVDGVRFKCRPDYLTGHTVLDMKSYGRPPRRGVALENHCTNLAVRGGADLQAVHNSQMVDLAAERFLAGEIEVHQRLDRDAGAARGRLGLFREIMEAARAEPPTFRWLFVRMGGPLSGVVVPFPRKCQEWADAAGDISDAVDIFNQYRARCGPTPWMTSAGERPFGPFAFPMREGAQ